MSKQEIIEGNKLIAEFMGSVNHPPLVPYIPEPDDMWFSVGNYPEERHPDDGSMWKLHELKYHSSWDWLMPVVEKIIKITEFKTVDECSEEEWYITTKLTRRTIGTPIRYIWYDVIEFIKWYNSCRK